MSADLKLFFTLTADDRVFATHQTLDAARDFARNWVDLSGANRTPDRIVTAMRDSKPIYARSDRFKVARTIETFSL